MKPDRDIVKGRTPTLILAVLADGPRHGYSIAREIERRSEALVKLGEGSLYPALMALEQGGLVEGTWETPPGGSGGPARKVYRLTEAGRAELAKGVRDWRAMTQAIDRIFGAPNDAPTGEEQPEERRKPAHPGGLPDAQPA